MFSTQPYSINPFGFQGLMHDEVTGNIYQRAREYSPRLGRFMQRDPLGYPDGMNTYAAYHVMWGGVDPSGAISLQIVRHHTTTAPLLGAQVAVTTTNPSEIDLLDSLEFIAKDDSGKKIPDLNGGPMTTKSGSNACCGIVIRWKGESQWHGLDVDPNNQRVMRAAGEAEIALACGLFTGGLPEISATDIIDVDIRFPSFQSITSDQDVKNQTAKT